MSYREFLEEALQQASDIALGYFGNVTASVKPEDNNQVLTEADVAVGKHLVAAVQEAFPEHNIIDEEAGVIDKGSSYTWVIDPIDGTANFAAGLPDYGIMIGLLEDDTPIAGGIMNPAHGDMYLAEKGKGATRNGVTIKATDEQDLSKVLLSYGMDGYQDAPELNEQQCTVLAEVLPKIRNFRNSGSEAIDNMYVADGRYGGRMNFSAKIWDAVAPHSICAEAGVLWTAANGAPVDYTNPLSKAGQNFTFCIAPLALHAQLQEIIRDRLPD